MTALTLDLSSVIRLTHEQFEQLALANRELRLELTAAGELVLPPEEETQAAAIAT